MADMVGERIKYTCNTYSQSRLDELKSRPLKNLRNGNTESNGLIIDNARVSIYPKMQDD